MAAGDAAKARELGQLRLEDLRAACQKRGLPTYGRKDQLMARIIEADKVRPAKTANPLVAAKKAICATPSGKNAKAATPARPKGGKEATPARPKCSKDATPARPKGGKEATPARPKCGKDATPARASAKSSQCSSCVDDARRSQSSRSIQEMSPVGKSIGTLPSGNRLQDLSPEGRAAPRRRLREKSPNPHRRQESFADLLQCPATPRPASSHEVHSPVQAPRRRLREKSPNPNRRRHDSPFRELAALAVGPSSPPARASAATPGKRARQKTPGIQIGAHREPAPPSYNPTDVSQALMLLKKRELLEMCHEWNVDTKDGPFDGTKAVLIQRLVDAHAAPRADSAEQVDPLATPKRTRTETRDDGSQHSGADSPPPKRVSLCPPPPASWTSPIAPISWASNEAVGPSALQQTDVETSAPPAEILQSQTAVCHSQASRPESAASPIQAKASRPESAVSPAQAEAATPPRTMPLLSSNDWWRSVAQRWPRIVANLKTGTTSPRKRSFESPSRSEGNESPKRHCPTPLRRSS